MTGGTVVNGRLDSAAAGSIDFRVYLPAGYAESDRRYASLYLLHGRGDSLDAWQSSIADIDRLIDAGQIEPPLVVMIDGRWNNRGSWWTDSHYSGTDPNAGGPGSFVQTAITGELVPHIDAAFRTIPAREARFVGGYSMGGSAALRYVTMHQEVFSRAIVMSAAIYVPQPPLTSSARDYGAYGVGERLFIGERFDELNYPATLARVDPGLPISLFIIVGDNEWQHPDPDDARHDLDFESATLYNTARRVPGVTADLRILSGGHDWEFWQRGLLEGFRAILSKDH